MNGAALIQFIAAIGGSAGLATLISVIASRRKNSAEVAEIWNRLTKDALEREEKSKNEIRAELEAMRRERDDIKAQLKSNEQQVRTCGHKYDRLAGLTRRLILEMPNETKRAEYEAALKFIDDSVA
ncbi:hypothetical protein SEA_GODONK_101 [Gordonia phage GodonK]|uniref:Uncharacterized protein n=1 Tax=Gordonia phage GodonK TaxID=2562192 RepID=A0A4D6E223_9CAUD|nr:hypothetical protein HOV33_gp101 [Gordonia phage GodonK]QBZ72720.1 hypothetical protein SEA_GODONK_101 [Gordonia phage GodonK]